MFEGSTAILELALRSLGYGSDSPLFLTFFALTFIRYFALAFVIPAFGIGFRSIAGKFAIAASLTVLTVPVIGQNAATDIASVPVILLGLREMIVGFCLGIGAGFIFEGVRAGGKIIESTLNIAPGGNLSDNIKGISDFKLILIALLFFVSGAYGPFLIAVTETTAALPVGQPFASADGWIPLITQAVSALFWIMAGVSLPFLFILVTGDVLIASIRSGASIGGSVAFGSVRTVLFIFALAVLFQVLSSRFLVLLGEATRALQSASGLFN